MEHVEGYTEKPQDDSEIDRQKMVEALVSTTDTKARNQCIPTGFYEYKSSSNRPHGQPLPVS